MTMILSYDIYELISLKFLIKFFKLNQTNQHKFSRSLIFVFIKERKSLQILKKLLLQIVLGERIR